jgi:hypothetical protein
MLLIKNLQVLSWDSGSSGRKVSKSWQCIVQSGSCWIHISRERLYELLHWGWWHLCDHTSVPTQIKLPASVLPLSSTDYCVTHPHSTLLHPTPPVHYTVTQMKQLHYVLVFKLLFLVTGVVSFFYYAGVVAKVLFVFLFRLLTNIWTFYTNMSFRYFLMHFVEHWKMRNQKRPLCKYHSDKDSYDYGISHDAHTLRTWKRKARGKDTESRDGRLELKPHPGEASRKTF